MKPILDACCGARMSWFDNENPLALFADLRNEEHTLCDGRVLKIAPDIVQDFRKMDFQDNTFHMVVFDPPHLLHAGQNSWLEKWRDFLGKTVDKLNDRGGMYSHAVRFGLIVETNKPVKFYFENFCKKDK